MFDAPSPWTFILKSWKCWKGSWLGKVPSYTHPWKNPRGSPPYRGDGEYDVPCGTGALGQLNVTRTPDVVLPEAHPVHSTQPPLLFYAPVAASLRTRNTVFPMESGSTAWRGCSFFLLHIIFSIHKHVRLSHLVSVHHHSRPVWCYRISLSITIQVLFGVIGFLND